MTFGYYPGCSLHATSREFDESLRLISGPLGIDLAPIDDWNCCGATSAHATNHLLSVALSARNLALAEQQGHASVLAPCAACYNRLATARHEVAQDPELAARMPDLIGRPFENRVRVLNVVEVLRDLAPAIRNLASHPLRDMKLACYYGCLLVRPAAVTHFDDAEDPHSMEEVVAATGAAPVNWPQRVDCCGGAFSLARTGSVIRLGRAIIDGARAAGADAIVVACPMCHSNLDLRQKAIARKDPGTSAMPILFVTQVVGMALGLPPKSLGLQRHFVNTTSVVNRMRELAPATSTQEGI